MRYDSSVSFLQNNQQMIEDADKLLDSSNQIIAEIEDMVDESTSLIAATELLCNNYNAMEEMNDNPKGLHSRVAMIERQNTVLLDIISNHLLSKT